MFLSTNSFLSYIRLFIHMSLFYMVGMFAIFFLFILFSNSFFLTSLIVSIHFLFSIKITIYQLLHKNFLFFWNYTKNFSNLVFNLMNRSCWFLMMVSLALKQPSLVSTNLVMISSKFSFFSWIHSSKQTSLFWINPATRFSMMDFY